MSTTCFTPAASSHLDAAGVVEVQGSPIFDSAADREALIQTFLDRDAYASAHKISCTLTQAADLAGLGAGVKTLAKNLGTLPTGARLLGWVIAEGSATMFDDATHGDFNLELGVAADPDAVMTSLSVKAGATGFPKTGTAGVKGFPMVLCGGFTIQALLTGSVDLNTATAGSMTICLFYVICP